PREFIAPAAGSAKFEYARQVESTNGDAWRSPWGSANFVSSLRPGGSLAFGGGDATAQRTLFVLEGSLAEDDIEVCL
ncbi:MAG: hypothetical protein ACK53L_33205, partial [Pirellulaceae bacterium]